MIVPGSANPLLLGQTSGYNLTRSLRFRRSANAYLSRTLSAGNDTTWTFSCWLKRGSLASGAYYTIFSARTGQQTFLLRFSDSDLDKLQIFVRDSSNVTQGNYFSNAVYRDPSAWYHIVLAIDTRQTTAANRVLLYVNNVAQTLTASTTISQNQNTFANIAVEHNIGEQPTVSDGAFDGYMTEINFIGGSQLTPSSFGQTSSTTGVWQPAKYLGTYGTNGFYLPFTDTSALTSGSNAGLGKDFSGNGNYWNTNNISITSGSTYDSMTDVPTLTSATAANFCVWNPLNSGATISEANLTATTSSWTDASGSMGMSSGKWYAEFTYNTASTTQALVGITLASFNGSGQSDNFRLAYQNIGEIDRDGVATPAALTGYPTYTAGDIIGIAVDVTNGVITFYKNNTQVYTFTTSVITQNEWRFFARMNSRSFTANFGQRPFAYTPPTGYVALNTYNLPTPTIGATASSQANKYFDINLYTANGTGQTLTNSGGMQPDFAWFKSRSNGFGHALIDSVRGVSKVLSSNATSAENTSPAGADLLSFNSNGVTLGTGYYGSINDGTSSNVLWQWRANGTGVTNTAGSITSTVSANTTSGFSVVTWTGTGSNATIGHGLGVAPKFIIVKRRDSAANWPVQGGGWGPQEVVVYYLNSTNGYNYPVPTIWNDTAPTSSVFSVGSSAEVNASGGTYVAYIWTDIAGYSKSGSYQGNGSTDGPFIYTGFKPKYLLLKNRDALGGWVILDSSRSTYNVVGNELYANASSAEGSGYTDADFLSNGFKLRVASDPNASSTYYIYMAFAENPFKYSLAR